MSSLSRYPLAGHNGYNLSGQGSNFVLFSEQFSIGDIPNVFG